MPYPEVVEMRKRLMTIYRMYKAAIRSGHKPEAIELMRKWDREEISTEELIERLRELIETSSRG